MRVSTVFLLASLALLAVVFVAGQDSIDYDEPLVEVSTAAPNEVLFPQEGMSDVQLRTQLQQILNTVDAENMNAGTLSAGHSMHTMTIPDFAPCKQICKLVECCAPTTARRLLTNEHTCENGHPKTGYAAIWRIAHNKYAYALLMDDPFLSVRQIFLDWMSPAGSSNGYSHSLGVPPFVYDQTYRDQTTTLLNKCPNPSTNWNLRLKLHNTLLLPGYGFVLKTPDNTFINQADFAVVATRNRKTHTFRCEPEDGGFVVGDPQFVGLRGQSYQVHGVSGEVYNIVSDADLQYNSRFVFLNQGACPVVNGKKQKGCWSHPGSYLGELGLKTRAGDKIHFVTGPAKVGFEAVEVNGKAVEEGETVLLADDMGSVSRNSTHLASVSIGNWEFAFENSDMFVNQRVRVLDARKLRSHGLLGQTWRDVTYPNTIKYIQGAVDDYVIRDNDIFGDNFVFNTFN